MWVSRCLSVATASSLLFGFVLASRLALGESYEERLREYQLLGTMGRDLTLSNDEQIQLALVGQKIRANVGRVTVVKGNSTSYSWGTAFPISTTQPLFVTALHVQMPAPAEPQRITISFPGNRTYEITKIYHHPSVLSLEKLRGELKSPVNVPIHDVYPELDLVVLESEGGPRPTAAIPLADRKEVERSLARAVLTVGHGVPSWEWSRMPAASRVTTGFIRAIGAHPRRPSGPPVIEHTCRSYQGDSGAPVLDPQGVLLGINVQCLQLRPDPFALPDDRYIVGGLAVPVGALWDILEHYELTRVVARSKERTCVGQVGTKPLQ